MKLIYRLYTVAGFWLIASAEIYITTLPDGTQIDGSLSSIPYNDISNLVTHLFGLPSRSESKWKGVVSSDVFNHPKANLLLNIQVPAKVKYTLNKYVAKYEVENNIKTPSLESTNVALTQVYKDRNPMIVYFERDGKLFNVAKLNAPMLSDLPAALDAVRDRLESRPSIVDSLPSDSCLRLSQDSDAYFLGELQTLDDILTKVLENRNLIEDSAPDSYVFTVTALNDLVQQYGADSCQVKTAVDVLETFIPKLVNRFDNLYRQRLMSEVNVVPPIGHVLNDVTIRHTRSVQDAAGDDKAHKSNIIENALDSLDPDYAVTVNLTFWVVVVFALATLAASYGIWFMDPGWDSVIYRMTTQRMKFD